MIWWDCFSKRYAQNNRTIVRAPSSAVEGWPGIRPSMQECGSLVKAEMDSTESPWLGEIVSRKDMLRIVKQAYGEQAMSTETFLSLQG
jgi:hypothetical protein